MARHGLDLKCEIYTAWWWPIYVYGVATVAVLFRLEPDLQKVENMAKRALRVRVITKAKVE